MNENFVLRVAGVAILAVVLSALIVLYLSERSQSDIYKAKYEQAWKQYVHSTTK